MHISIAPDCSISMTCDSSSLKCGNSVAGITARFGEDIFDRLRKEKSIQAHDVTASSGPDSWTLTEEARSSSSTLPA